MLFGRCSVVGSTKDLKPDSLIVDRRMRRREVSARPRGRSGDCWRIWIRFPRQVIDSTWRGTGRSDQSMSIAARSRLQAVAATGPCREPPLMETAAPWLAVGTRLRSEEHTSELQSLMRISYAVFCLKKKNTTRHKT